MIEVDMTLTLELPPEIEDMYRELAQTRGVSINTVIREVLISAKPASPPQSVDRLSTETWFKEFEQWADSFPDAPPIPDEALRRENLYPDR